MMSKSAGREEDKCGVKSISDETEGCRGERWTSYHGCTEGTLEYQEHLLSNQILKFCLPFRI